MRISVLSNCFNYNSFTNIDGRPRIAKPSINDGGSGGDCSHRSGFISRLLPLSLMEFADWLLNHVSALKNVQCRYRVLPVTV
jgi:hypothetical protein